MPERPVPRERPAQESPDPVVRAGTCYRLTGRRRGADVGDQDLAVLIWSQYSVLPFTMQTWIQISVSSAMSPLAQPLQ